MENFDVPCPLCGSIRVTVRVRRDLAPQAGSSRNEDPSRSPIVHACSCEDCRHTFRHDFAFTR